MKITLHLEYDGDNSGAEDTDLLRWLTDDDDQAALKFEEALIAAILATPTRYGAPLVDAARKIMADGIEFERRLEAERQMRQQIARRPPRTARHAL